MGLKIKNEFNHDTEIFHFMFEHSGNKKTRHEHNHLYVSDIKGQLLKLDCNTHTIEYAEWKDEDKRAMGYMDFDENSLYYADYGTNFIRIYNIET